jgi:P4 family phage/plasmid primase-like protien
MSSTALSQSNPRAITGYRDITDFLIKHTIQKGTQTTNPKTITNTRIGDKEQNIFGGSYHIPESEYPTFLALYYRDVVAVNKKEYLTEKQLETGGPILVDIDIRHDYDVDERQYQLEHVEDLIDIYLGELQNMFQLEDDTEFSIFVLEKPSVNRVADKKITKDGIHLIFGLQADHVTQLMLRERVMPQVAEAWSDLPIRNSWEDVFDKGISQGGTNWQLFGSRKPNHVSYKLTHVYNIQVDSLDKALMRSETPLNTFDIGRNINQLSVRYKDHPALFMKNSFITEYEQYKRENGIGGGGGVPAASASVARQQRMELITDEGSTLSRIRSEEELDLILNHFLDNIPTSEYELKDSYDFTMILPPTYYEQGSYAKWIRVGWALRNTSNKLLIVWLKFSSKATSFMYSSIPELCDMWKKFDNRGQNGLTKLSLMHWARTDAKEAYEQVRRNTIDYFIEQTINAPSTSKNDDRGGAGDFDLANVLYQLYKHEFVCVSVKANIWYQYKNHRWQEIDSGTTLRKAISIQLRDLYNQKSIDLMNRMTSENNGQAATEQLNGNGSDDEPGKSRSHRILNICQRLSRTNDKKNIMTEAKELFYDGNFLSSLDINPYLLCFKNGVFDFKEKVFRRGYPEDNISMCTGIEYNELSPFVHQSVMDEINDFMRKLFPEPQLCEYMWDHLASTLVGTSPNQTFNMYIGIGQNGKSVLVNLMEKVLGEYKGDVPLTLVTEKRGKVGGLAPEIVQLKGKRYAVMQEPAKGDRINEGMMKQLTSGKDPIQGRAPYMPQTISFLPQFKLVVTCNVLLEIKSNDHGTWRRIRTVPFKSLFTENPVEGDKEKPYQFVIDKYIDEKFDNWAPVFASMLVKRVCETNGEVKDCSIVDEKSKEYRKSQDYLSEFVSDRIVRCEFKFVKKMELNNEFSLWYASNYGGRGPGPKDLHEYMDKMFGRQQNQMWSGIKIKYENQSVDDEELTNELASNSDIAVDDL